MKPVVDVAASHGNRTQDIGSSSFCESRNLIRVVLRTRAQLRDHRHTKFASLESV